MNAVTDAGAIRLLDNLTARIGVFNIVQRLMTHDGAGWEDLHCGFAEKSPNMVVAERLGDEQFEDAHYLPGRRLAPLLDNRISKVVESRRHRITELRALVLRDLPRAYEALGYGTEDLEAELEACAKRLQARHPAYEELFPWESSEDPVKRAFHHVFLDQLQELLSKLAQGQTWSGDRQTFVPETESGRVTAVVLKAELFGLSTQTRIGSTEFCQHLFSHLCAVTAYYQGLADKAQRIAEETLPKLIERMKRRGVW